MFDIRSHLLWLVTPLVLVVGVFAGVTSATTEEVAHVSTPPPRPTGEATAPRPYTVAGRVVFVDVQARTVIVQARNGKFVDVFFAANTTIRENKKNIRPRDIGVGDRVVVVGKPHTRYGIDAAVMTVMPKSDSANSPPK